MNLHLLKPLVMMQLKDKIDLSFLKSTKQTINKIVFAILGFIVTTAFTALLFYVARRFNVFSLLNAVPVSVMTVLFTLMMTLSIVSCTYGLMKALYFSKDNLVLLTFPVTPNMVFLSKLIVFYVYEVKRTVSFLLPMFIGYGIIGGFTPLYFLWIIFAFIFISAIPVVTGALLSIPAMLISQFLKRFKALQLLLFTGVLVAGFFGVMKAIALIPSNINIIGTWGIIFWKIQDLLTWFVGVFEPFHKLVLFMVGDHINFVQVLFTQNTLPTFGLLLAFLVVVFGLSFALVRPLFFKMSSKPFEFRNRNVKHAKKNKKRGKFISSIRKEFVINFRTTELIATNFILFASLPVAIFLLNKIYAAMNTRLVGEYMTFSFNILVILLIVLSSNYVIASAFSKEGASGYLIKTKPASYHISLLSKLVFHALTTTASLIVTVVVLQAVNQMPTLNLWLLFGTVFFISIGHLMWSAELDIMNPQNRQYATTGGHTNNPNEAKSTLYAFMLSFLFFGASLFLFGEGILLAWVKLCVIAFVFMIFRIYLFVEKVKVYYKEVA